MEHIMEVAFRSSRQDRDKDLGQQIADFFIIPVTSINDAGSFEHAFDNVTGKDTLMPTKFDLRPDLVAEADAFHRIGDTNAFSFALQHRE